MRAVIGDSRGMLYDVKNVLPKKVQNRRSRNSPPITFGYQLLLLLLLLLIAMSWFLDQLNDFSVVAVAVCARGF